MELIEIRKKIEELTAQKNKLDGILENLQNTLKEAGYSNLKEAKEAVIKWEKQYKEAKAAFELEKESIISKWEVVL